MFENQKKSENMEEKEIFYINLHASDRLDIEFTACEDELTPEGVSE